MTGDAGSRLSVELEDGGQRLDAFVGARLGISRAAARRLIAAGHVRVGGRRREKGVLVTPGQVVTVVGAVDVSGEIAADHGRPIEVIHEDQAILAIDKPAGMPSHPLRHGERGTAANLMVARDPACATASPDPREGGLAHRLDTGTSGVLLAARTREAWLGLRAALAAPDCEKRYLAEVWGSPPAEGHMTAAIGRRGRRGTAVRIEGGRNPRAAATAWTVVDRRGATAIVEARLHAGRPHQVRAHLAAAGFPIVGDDRYGAGTRSTASPSASSPSPDDGPPGLRLHAASVAFRHPITGDRLVVTARRPAWATASGSPPPSSEPPAR